jgi:bacillithiol biosynthesis cysteine-adding enzyme BshC
LAYRAAAAEIEFSDDRRATLVAALRRRNSGSAALERLAEPGTVAVVTGQQVGLFSGPAYTVYKALTAAKLARRLTENGIPAVPVFWLATEDHDLAEVNHCWVFDPQQRPRKLQVLGSTGSSQPVGNVRLTAPPLCKLREALAGLPFAEEAADLVTETYLPGRTMGEAFSELLKRLLAEYDLIHVDPMSPEIRALAAPVIQKALAQAPELTAAVMARNQELIQAGYHAQVHVENHTSFVFLLENDRRLTLRRHERDYIVNGRRFSTEELMDRAEELSPNALLRPVVQDSILPTAAYIGGPAELAYLAQARVIYDAILGRMPVALHRAGFTLLDQRARKLLARYGLAVTDCFHGEEILRERISGRLVPPALRSTIEDTQRDVSRALARLAGDLAGFDATLAAALAKNRKKIEYQVSKMERKIGRETMLRDSRVAQDAAFLHGLIYPDRHLQERLYSIVPFLAKHGGELIGGLYENVRLDCPDHQLLVV